jgi:hypothetical protein
MARHKRWTKFREACHGKHESSAAKRGRLFMLAGFAVLLEALGAVMWRRFRAHRA